MDFPVFPNLGHLKGFPQQSNLLGLMLTCKTRRHARCSRPACKPQPAASMLTSRIEDSLQPRPRERPRTIVESLLLAPDDIRRAGILLQDVVDFLPREWMQLLNACNRGIRDILRLAVFVQCEIYLTAAVDDSFDAGSVECRVSVAWIRDDRMELGLADKVLDVRFDERVAKERFREEDNQSCINAGVSTVRSSSLEKPEGWDSRFLKSRCSCRRSTWNRFAGEVI